MQTAPVQSASEAPEPVSQVSQKQAETPSSSTNTGAASASRNGVSADRLQQKTADAEAAKIASNAESIVSANQNFRAASGASSTGAGATKATAADVEIPWGKRISGGVAGKQVYIVGEDGKAPANLKAGDLVMTTDGTYKITAVNPDGSYQSVKDNGAYFDPNEYVNRTLKQLNDDYYYDGQGRIYTRDGACVGDVVNGDRVSEDGTYIIRRDGTQERPTFVAAYADAPGPVIGVGNANTGGVASVNGANAGNAVSNQRTTQGAQIGAAAQSPIGQTSVGASATGTGQPSGLTAPDLTPIMDAWRTAAERSAELKTDYAVEKAVNELQRAQEDAQKEFRTAQEQISAEEAYNKDNQALYAEARGDKGGIGAAQYDSIMNTAAINRQAVREQQTKLATDTWRQIADLRAQGEFEKADAVLEISQTYLSNLLELEQWAANYNLSAAQFEESIREWEKNFQLSVAELTGTYNGQQTLAAKNADRNFALNEANITGTYNGGQTLAARNAEYDRQQNETKTLASAGTALLNAGIMPSEDQLKAMGMTSDQAQSLIIAAQAAAAAKGGGGGGVPADAYEIMAKAGAKTEGQAYNALLNAGYSDSKAKTLAAYYIADLETEKTANPTYNINVLSDAGRQILAQAAYQATLGSSLEAELAGLMDKAITARELDPNGADYKALVSYAKGGK